MQSPDCTLARATGTGKCNIVCIQSKKLKRKNAEDMLSSDNGTPNAIELGERPIPVFVIKKLSRARRGWGHVGNNT